jgi:hypothetical protein
MPVEKVQNSNEELVRILLLVSCTQHILLNKVDETSLSDPYSFDPDPDPAFEAED